MSLLDIGGEKGKVIKVNIYSANKHWIRYKAIFI